ncbi:probable V-type proton ATPase subunit d 2 [Drosophila montana]|uniref:probable V-type proton ATPase subunit d 2 n=1 Tax=Drosophila montana TaxID=40370 RepID=UPI00313DD1FF
MSVSWMFNVESGYLEGLVRGFKNGLLKQSDYLNLTQCETLQDLLLNIQNTDYGHILTNETEVANVEVIEKRMRERIVIQYNYMRVNSTEPLSTFLDYIRYEHMIDNIALLMAGLNNRRPMKKLLPMCHPLGLFDQLEAIAVASNIDELFNTVLIDTPISKFISKKFDKMVIHNTDVEIQRSMIYKSYLEDFYKFCKKLGGTTAEVMCNILSFQADRRTIVIAVNSLHTDMEPKIRESLFPTCGKLCPVMRKLLATSADFEQVRSAVSKSMAYAGVFNNIERDTDNLITLDDRFLMLEAKMHVNSYLQQFHYGIFYSYLKLKELECRNIIWIAECISQRQNDKINAYIPIPIY